MRLFKFQIVRRIVAEIYCRHISSSNYWCDVGFKGVLVSLCVCMWVCVCVREIKHTALALSTSPRFFKQQQQNTLSFLEL